MNEATLRDISVRLQVLKANDRARLLYQRLGFSVTGESDRHYVMEWKYDSIPALNQRSQE